jgi:BON domain
MRFRKLLGTAALTLLLAETAAFAQSVPQAPQPVPDNVPGDQTPNGGVQAPPPGGASLYKQKMTAHHVGNHKYDSPADQANDALLITEVKSALANADLGQPYAITVDADHGTVILTGEVPSHASAGQIYQIASQCDGVKAVQSHLDWPSKAN